MTENEQVSDALACLPRPAAPPRLHRQIMAQVQAEARAEANTSQFQTWRRMETDGGAAEHWKETRLPEDTASVPELIHINGTYWRQSEMGQTVIYEFTQKY